MQETVVVLQEDMRRKVEKYQEPSADEQVNVHMGCNENSI
jgi:hypothetical protein